METAKGSISVVLALSFTIILSFCLVLIESARENTMLLKAEIIFDTCVQSVLAEYHAVLWEEYDLLYVDASYGADLPDYELVKSRANFYADKNIGLDKFGWLAMEYEGTGISGVVLATDHSCEDFYRQAVKAAEESVGISYIEQMLWWLKEIESKSYLETILQEDSKSNSKEIEEADGSMIEVKEAVWGEDEDGEPILLEEAEYEEVKIDNPLAGINIGSLFLGQVLGDASKVSKVKVPLDRLASGRAMAVGSISAEESRDWNIAENIWDKAFFCKYIMDHFDSYTDVEVFSAKENGTGKSPEDSDAASEDGTLQYTLEYIISGKDSDEGNLSAALGKLLLIREVDNYLYLLQDEVRRIEAEALGTVIAAVAGVPWLGTVVTHSILLLWAYQDSISDLKQLLEGKDVPLIKSLHLESKVEISLDYEEYLVLLLLLQGREKLILRSMDMIEMNVRKNQSGFRMDGCVSRAILTGTFSDIYDKRYTITKKMEYYHLEGT